MGEHFAEGCGDGGEEVEEKSCSGELLQEENAEGGEDKVGGPDTEDGERWPDLANATPMLEMR